MSNCTRYVGLDVHKSTIAMAVADAGREEARVLTTIRHDVSKLLKILEGLGGDDRVKVCYEAGPTGFGLQRALAGEGYDCQVVAPSLIPSKGGQVRIKTDRRDAARLAHFLRSGDLTPIRVPDEKTEAIRDLERAREDAKQDEKRARQRLGKFLLRHGRHWIGRSNWTRAHMEWIRAQRFDFEAQNQVLREYLNILDQACQAVRRLDDAITESIEDWSLRPLIENLQTLRGVRQLTATVIAAEVGDLKRFQTARQFMSYVGLVPSEHSSGDTIKRGRITKAGNKHLRRMLVEAAWSYRFSPRMSRTIQIRNTDRPPEIQAIAWTAQERLARKYRKMTSRGRPHNLTVASMARELAGFIWAIGIQTELAP
jgi:transposase